MAEATVDNLNLADEIPTNRYKITALLSAIFETSWIYVQMPRKLRS